VLLAHVYTVTTNTLRHVPDGQALKQAYEDIIAHRASEIKGLVGTNCIGLQKTEYLISRMQRHEFTEHVLEEHISPRLDEDWELGRRRLSPETS
jgi:hypothetical protein